MNEETEIAPEIGREEKPAPPSTVGAMLQAAREARGLSLAQAEKATRIRQAYLEALEEEDWACLPESTFTKGFLRTYALYLGLDAPALLRQYHQQVKVPAKEEPTVRPATRPLRTPSTIGINLLVGALFFLGFILLGAYIYYRQYLPEATPTPTLVISTALPPTATPVLPTPSPDVTVPDVVGLTSTQAEEKLTPLGLKLEILEWRFDSRVPSGSIVSQGVAPGSRAKRGTTIGVVVSRGADVLSVPNVVNLPFNEAQSRLSALGLRVNRQDAQSVQVAAGLVMGQDPAPGTAVPRGSTVAVVVSAGSPKRVVPNVIGKPEVEALAILKEAGLIVAGINRQGAGDLPPDVLKAVPVGAVLSTTPAPGTPYDPGASIYIAVRKE
ncbi:MAG: PASTA domain-containing protein [Chloroflexi bacterium]|nr:PASTA domain-containing protein [Chloroflexota bacterium]